MLLKIMLLTILSLLITGFVFNSLITNNFVSKSYAIDNATQMTIPNDYINNKIIDSPIKNYLFDPFSNTSNIIGDKIVRDDMVPRNNDLISSENIGPKGLFSSKNGVCSSIFDNSIFEIADTFLQQNNMKNIVDCAVNNENGAKKSYIVWSEGDEDSRRIYFRKDSDASGFSEPTILSDKNPSAVFTPKISSNGTNVFVVWQGDSSTGNQDIFFRKSADGGNTFGDTINLSNNKLGSGNPYIVSNGKYVYVVWEGTTPDNKGIFFRMSDDYGATFSDTQNVSDNTLLAYLPKIQLSGDDVSIFWKGYTDGINNIFVKKSPDAGFNFDRIKVLTKDLFGVWQ